MSVVVQQPAPELRPMRAQDVAAVLAIEQRVYPFPWTEGIFRDCLRVGYDCWVLNQGETVIGYGIMSLGPGEAHILNLAVNPAFQRRGLGRQILGHLLASARHRQAETVFLEVRPSNIAALQLYSALGFNQVGERRDYYPAEQGREDALILALEL